MSKKFRLFRSLGLCILGAMLVSGCAGVPEQIGGAVQTQAQQTEDFAPGYYSARYDCEIYNAPASNASVIGKLKQGTSEYIYDVQWKGDSAFGQIGSETSDTWVMLTNGRRRSFQLDQD
jgi:hypothetical protein